MQVICCSWRDEQLCLYRRPGWFLRQAACMRPRMSAPPGDPLPSLKRIWSTPCPSGTVASTAPSLRARTSTATTSLQMIDRLLLRLTERESLQLHEDQSIKQGTSAHLCRAARMMFWSSVRATVPTISGASMK